jgi:hypothetical protein
MASVVNTNRPTTLSSGATASGVLHVNTTAYANLANTSEQDAWTYTLPANTMSADGKVLRVTVTGTTAANANTKTVRFYFGNATAHAVMGASASNNETWTATFIVIRTGESASTVLKQYAGSGTTYRGVSTQSSTSSHAANITIKVSLQSPTTGAAGDVAFTLAIVELLN